MKIRARSLFYVSRKLDVTDRSVVDIVETSRFRNARLDVTGALVSARENFAQILEGPEAALDDLMESIGRDTRHTDIEILRDGPIDRCTFSNWSLAYAGPSTYISRQLGDLLARDGDRSHRADRVTALIAGLAGASVDLRG